jgi:hypothetical protein
VTGFVVLAAALAAAASVGIWRLRTDGRFTGSPAIEKRPVVEARGALATTLEATGAELGERATLLQFSSAFCAPCRTTRVVLGDVASREPGVSHVELDAEAHLDLVRALDVRRTPTTLVLDAAGRELVRAAGAPRREQVLAALPNAGG